MKYLKLFLILILVWPKFWYAKVAGKLEEDWKTDGEIPPQYSEKTKRLIKKQKRAKIWTLIMSIFPLGPISLFVTWLSFRFEDKKTIEYYVSQQIPEVEELKELKRKRRETIVKYLEERLKVEDNIDWENVTLPSREDEFQLREFLFGESGILTKEPKKEEYKNKKDEKQIEEFNF